MQNIEKFNFPNEIFKNVILITTIEDPYFLRDEIYDAVADSDNSQFYVLVDLFLRNGYSFNRYSLLNFNGKSNCKSIIINPIQVADNIKETIKSFLLSNPDILNESVLSKNTINFMKSS